MEVGDLIQLREGAVTAFGLSSPFIVLLEKVARRDLHGYDWKCLADGRKVMLGRQIEESYSAIK